MLIGALPRWPHSANWGYYPSGGVGIVLIILITAGTTTLVKHIGIGMGFLPIRDMVPYHTLQSTSPPTPAFLAARPVITPREVVRILEVQGNGALVAIPDHERRALAADERRHPPRAVAAVGPLDLDDVGAVHAKQHRAVGPGEMTGQIDDPEPL